MEISNTRFALALVGLVGSVIVIAQMVQELKKSDPHNESKRSAAFYKAWKQLTKSIAYRESNEEERKAMAEAFWSNF